MDIFGSAATSTAFLASVATSVKNTTVNMWGVIALVVGVPLAFYMLYKVVHLFKGDTGGSWYNRMTYYPFKGSHRGYWYRLPSPLQREWMP